MGTMARAESPRMSPGHMREVAPAGSRTALPAATARAPTRKAASRPEMAAPVELEEAEDRITSRPGDSEGEVASKEPAPQITRGACLGVAAAAAATAVVALASMSSFRDARIGPVVAEVVRS